MSNVALSPKGQSMRTVTAKSDEVEVMQAGKRLISGVVPPLTMENMDDPIQRAHKWYLRMGCPTRDEMIAKMKKHPRADITEEDILLLPWNEGRSSSWRYEQTDIVQSPRKAERSRQKEMYDRLKKRMSANEGRKKEEEQASKKEEEANKKRLELKAKLQAKQKEARKQREDVNIEQKEEAEKQKNRREEEQRLRKEAEEAEKEAQRRKQEEEDRRRKEALKEEQRRKETEAAELRRKEAEEAERRRKEAEAAERRRKEAEAAELRRKEAEAAELRRKEAEAAERKRKEAEAAERKRKEAEEAERKRKEALEAERKRKEALEAERKRKEALEAERKRKEALEAERKRKAAEEAERKRKEALEAERKRKEAEEAERMRKAAEEAERKRKAAEEAERKRKAAEEAERKRKEAEEAERKRKEAEEAERKRKEAEEKERKRKEALERERKRKEAEEADRRRMEELARKRQEAEEAERKRKEAEETERKRKEAEEAERKRKEAEEKERKRKEALERERKRKEAEEADRRRMEELARKRQEAEERQRKEAEEAKQRKVEEEKLKKCKQAEAGTYIPKPGESLLYNPLGSLKVKRFDMVYKLGEAINEGFFGVVYKAHHVLNRPEDLVAVKIVNRTDPEEDQAVLNESSVLRDVKDLPNITELIDFYMDDEKLYVVQELAKGGDVFDRLVEKEKYTEDDARTLAKTLLTTMDNLHNISLLHRDLKPENLLLKDANNDTAILLCDFGFAEYLPKDGSGLSQHCGTPAFTSPEIVNGDEYWAEVDMWSIGCIIYMLLCGRQPFEGDDAELYQYIATADYGFDDAIWNTVSKEAKDLISHLMILDKKKRLTARKALQSSWFTGCTKAQLKNNDLSETLHGMRHYIDNIRPKAKKQNCWRYDEVGWGRKAEELAKKRKEEEEAERRGKKEAEERKRKKAEEERKRKEAGEVARRRPSSYIPKPGESLTVDPLGSLKVKSFDMVYNVAESINEGFFGVVYKAHHVFNKPEDKVAVKIVNRSDDFEDGQVINETSILRDIRGFPNVVEVIDFYMDDEKLYVVQELARGGDVFDRLIEKERYTEDDARTLARTLLTAMESLHNIKIVHRDLKPENLLLKDCDDDTAILLCDFGCAKYLPEDGSGLLSHCGTPNFISPEIVNGDEYWAEVDMWSIGCIIFMLLCGQRPFEADEGDAAELYHYITTADYGFDDEEIWNTVSKEAKELINSLLTLDQKRRLTAREALKCAWFTGCTRTELKSHDLTAALIGMGQYNENIRPKAIHPNCWRYDEPAHLRTASARSGASSGDSDSSDDDSSGEDTDYESEIKVKSFIPFDPRANNVFESELNPMSRAPTIRISQNMSWGVKPKKKKSGSKKKKSSS